jgi:phage FluMu protein gp41
MWVAPTVELRAGAKVALRVDLKAVTTAGSMVAERAAESVVATVAVSAAMMAAE